MKRIVFIVYFAISGLLVLYCPAGGQENNLQNGPLLRAIYKIKVEFVLEGVFRDNDNNGPAFKILDLRRNTWSITKNFLGTGYLVDQEGYLITARHVIDPEEIIEHFFSKINGAYIIDTLETIILYYSIEGNLGHHYNTQLALKRKVSVGPIKIFSLEQDPNTAELLHIDPGYDLAVFKIKAKGQPFLNFGTVSDLKPEDRVYAVGYQGDGYEIRPSLVRGRAQFIGLNNGRTLIRTFPNVKDGYSGGPLITPEYKVVGMLLAISKPAYLHQAYSLPADKIETVYKRIKLNGQGRIPTEVKLRCN